MASRERRACRLPRDADPSAPGGYESSASCAEPERQAYQEVRGRHKNRVASSIPVAGVMGWQPFTRCGQRRRSLGRRKRGARSGVAASRPSGRPLIAKFSLSAPTASTMRIRRSDRYTCRPSRRDDSRSYAQTLAAVAHREMTAAQYPSSTREPFKPPTNWSGAS